MNRRPEPDWIHKPAPPPDGYRNIVVPDERWETVRGKRCRRKGCGAPAVAQFRRQHSSSMTGWTWWAYCADHLYGRWIEDGRVVGWRMVPDPEYGATEVVGPPDAG